MLAALEAVDLVVVFEEDTPLELIKRVRPAALVKGVRIAARIAITAVTDGSGLTTTAQFVTSKRVPSCTRESHRHQQR